MNTKYNLLSVLKTSEFSRVRSTGDYFDVSTHEMNIFLFTPPPPPPKKKVNFIFILFYTFYRLYAMSHPLKMQKTKKIASPNNFSTKIFDTF